MKNLHMFYNKKDLPWVRLIWSSYYQNEVPHATKEIGSFWWKDIMRLNIILRGIAQCKVPKGDSTLFWLDNWDGNNLAHSNSMLYSFAKDMKISVEEFVLELEIQNLFNNPLSEQAF